MEGEGENLGNIIYKPIVINDPILNYQEKKHTSLQFLLFEEFTGRYEELFITDKMRDLFAAREYESLLQLRKDLISQKEKEFISSLGIAYEE